jgi:DinB superfamily
MRMRPVKALDPVLSREMEILVRLVDEAYDKKSWHGPNLKGSIRGLSVPQAVWRPRPDRHCIAEQVLHAAYWKYTVRRRLRGDARGSFALKGSNWFPVPATLSAAEWKAHAALLESEHRLLRQTINIFPADRLHEVSPSAKVSHLAIILGIAAHDVYHAGQIQLLKRLQQDS